MISTKHCDGRHSICFTSPPPKKRFLFKFSDIQSCIQLTAILLWAHTERRQAVLWHWHFGVMLLDHVHKFHSLSSEGPLKFVMFNLRHSTLLGFLERQCFFFFLFELGMGCHCSFTHCSGAAWPQYNGNCMCVNVVPCILQDWLSSVCKTYSNLLLMLIENVLPHCINPACKIFLLKRLFSPKNVFVPGFLLQLFFFFFSPPFRQQHLLVDEISQRKS